MWRASSSSYRENIEGESDAQNGIEMIAASASDQRREDQGVATITKVSKMQVAFPAPSGEAVNPLASQYSDPMTAAAREAERKARRAKKATRSPRTVNKKGRAKRRSHWIELETDEGEKYYFNEKTEETSWTKPKGSSADHVHGKEGRGNTTGGEDGNGDWLEMQTDEGKTYFYNKASRKTSWSKEV